MIGWILFALLLGINIGVTVTLVSVREMIREGKLKEVKNGHAE